MHVAAQKASFRGGIYNMFTTISLIPSVSFPSYHCKPSPQALDHLEMCFEF